MKYRIKCTKQRVEPFFTEGKEYQIAHNNNMGYFIKDDDGDTVENAETVNELLSNLNEYWFSQFELIEIEPKQLEVKQAWLVTVDYKVPAMRGFSSYEGALKYYHEMINKVEEQIEERNCEQIESYSSGKPLLTHFREWDDEYKYFATLGLVSIKQIEWEEE